MFAELKLQTRHSALAATRSGDLNALTQLLASDVWVVTDGGGNAAAADLAPHETCSLRGCFSDDGSCSA
jgi:hypothetical protein